MYITPHIFMEKNHYPNLTHFRKLSMVFEASPLFLTLLGLLAGIPRISCHSYVSLPPPSPSTKISALPLMMAHNSPTAYLPNTVTFEPYNPYYQNQLAPFSQQLDCGIRGLDLRPCMIDSVLRFRHGAVVVPNVTLADLAAETKAWVEANKEDAQDDLIFFYLSNSGSEDSDVCGTYEDNLQASIALLDEAGIPYVDDTTLKVSEG